MPISHIEVSIRNLLKDHGTPFVADDLLKRWNMKELSAEDQELAAQFLIHAGFYTTLKNHISTLLTQDRPIPWIAYIELLCHTNEQIPDAIADHILVGMAEENRLEDIVYCQKAATLHPKLNKIIEKLTLQKINDNTARKKEKLEKLQRQVQDQLDQDAKKTSEELKKEFPTDAHVIHATSELDLARIKNLVDKKQREYSYAETITGFEDTATKTQIIKDAASNAKKNPSMAYNISILLTQMEAFDGALKCLDFAPDSPEKDWLNLDLLIKAKSYLEALSKSFDIEKKYADNPSTIFSVLEIRAQAFYGLNEKHKAIQILEKLVEIQPKNQIAQMLLQSWKDLA